MDSPKEKTTISMAIKKKKKNNVRVIFISSRTRKKKKEYYFTVREYRGGDLSYQIPRKFNYSAFRKTFSKKSEAVAYGYQTAVKMEKRYPSIRFFTRFLED
jgi:hypothetical protein